MKNLTIIIILLLIAACNAPENVHYALANNAIDSFVKQDKEFNDICKRHQRGEGLDAYATAVINRYVFARIYQEEADRLERGEAKNNLVKRYNKEVKRDPYDFFPVPGMSADQKEIFYGH
jgi:hypothetical protein